MPAGMLVAAKKAAAVVAAGITAKANALLASAQKAMAVVKAAAAKAAKAKVAGPIPGLVYFGGAAPSHAAQHQLLEDSREDRSQADRQLDQAAVVEEAVEEVLLLRSQVCQMLGYSDRADS